MVQLTTRKTDVAKGKSEAADLTSLGNSAGLDRIKGTKFCFEIQQPTEEGDDVSAKGHARDKRSNLSRDRVCQATARTQVC